MDFTIEISKAFNLSPFSVLKQDKDEVIMLINYFIEKGEDAHIEQKTSTKSSGKSAERIRVNDRTATGGWF